MKFLSPRSQFKVNSRSHLQRLYHLVAVGVDVAVVVAPPISYDAVLLVMFKTSQTTTHKFGKNHHYSPLLLLQHHRRQHPYYYSQMGQEQPNQATKQPSKPSNQPPMCRQQSVSCIALRNCRCSWQCWVYARSRCQAASWQCWVCARRRWSVARSCALGDAGRTGGARLCHHCLCAACDGVAARARGCAPAVPWMLRKG